MTQKKHRLAGNQAAAMSRGADTDKDTPTAPNTPTWARASQQVSWSDVHAFVLPKLVLAGDWPMIGSPAWCDLDGRDRAKWASVLDAAQHWALRIEHLQQAECESSHDISAAEDWSKLADTIRNRDDYLTARGEPAEHFRPWTSRSSR